MATTVVCVAAIAACGTPSQPGGEPTALPDGGFGWFAFATGPTDASGRLVGTPVDAIERSGLVLPANAKVQRVETQSGPIGTESYLFVFQADSAIATAFCEQGGLGGAVAVPDTATSVMLALGNPIVTESSRWCASRSPKDPTWSRYALIEAGNPSTIRLALHRGEQ